MKKLTDLVTHQFFTSSIFIVLSFNYLASIVFIALEAITWHGVVQKYLLIPALLPVWLFVITWFSMLGLSTTQKSLLQRNPLTWVGVIITWLTAGLFGVSLLAGTFTSLPLILEQSYRIHWHWLNQGIVQIFLLSCLLVIIHYSPNLGIVHGSSKHAQLQIMEQKQNVLFHHSWGSLTLSHQLLFLAFFTIMSLLLYLQLTIHDVRHLIIAGGIGFILCQTALSVTKDL